MKFSKKYFEEEIESIDELFNPNGKFGGDKPTIAHTQVTTDTQKSFDDESDFEEDIPQTSDDFATKAKNKHNNYGFSNMGMAYGTSNIRESNKSKGEIKKLVKELISKRTDDKGLVKHSDNNDNNIADINELKNPLIISKINEFLKSIKSNNLSGEELAIILNHVINNFELPKLSNEIKTKIKNNL